MKKVLGILLGICVAAPVMAASVSEINKDAYMHHIKEMSMMRKHIFHLMNKENKTAEEQAAYEDLMAKFDAKRASWDEYLKAVADDDEEGRAKVEKKFENGERRHHHKKFKKSHKHHEKCCEGQKCAEDKKCCERKHHKKHHRPHRHHRRHNRQNQCNK